MGKYDYFAKGDYNQICDYCGQKYKASKTRMTWNKLIACPTCFEIRNPQDFVRGVKDDMRVPIPRPDVAPKFITSPVTPDDL